MIRRDPVETGGRYFRVLPEGSVEGWDGYTLRMKKPKQGLDLNRNFPANWRQEFEQLGAGPFPDVGAGSARGHGVRHRPHEHHRRHVVPHVERRAAAPVRARVRRRDARRGSVALPEDGRQGPRAHRVSGHFRLSRVSLSPEGGDRRHVRLALRAPRHVHVGRGDLEPDARGGHRELPVHRLVPRPPHRRRPQALSMEPRQARRRSRTSRGSRSIIRSWGRSSSAAGTGSTRSRIRRRRCSSANCSAFRDGWCGRR